VNHLDYSKFSGILQFKYNEGISTNLQQLIDTRNALKKAHETILELTETSFRDADRDFIVSIIMPQIKSASKWLNFAIDRLSYPKSSELFPIAMCKREAFSFLPEDVVINFYIEKGHLYCTLNVISCSNGTQPVTGHNRNRSNLGQASSLVVSGGQSISGKNYIFYNGVPTEVLYSLKLSAELSNLIQRKLSLQTASRALEDMLNNLKLVAL